MVAVCLAGPWVTRVLLLGEKHLAPSIVDVRGLLADASVALCVLGLVGLLLLPGRWWSRVLAWIALASFVVVISPAVATDPPPDWLKAPSIVMSAAAAIVSAPAFAIETVPP